MRFVCADVLFQRSQQARAGFVRHHVKVQGQNQRGLCLADKAACRGDILGAEGLYKPLAPLPPAVFLGGVAQHVGRVGQNLQTPRKADIGYKVIIGRALALITQAGALGVQPQPVTVLVPGLPTYR